MVVVMMIVLFMLMLMFMFMFMFFMFMFVLVVQVLYFANPRSRGGSFLEVEQMGVQQICQFHIAVVAGNDAGGGLQGADYFLGMFQFFAAHLARLVQQDDVAELNLLDHKVLDVLFGNVFLQQVESAFELVAQAKCVYHSHDGVETRSAALGVAGVHLGDGADGLGDGGGLTNAACLNHDVVELVALDDVVQLLHQIHFQCAADAAVLQCHQRVVLFLHHAALLNQVGVDVHLANVVHDDGKAYSLLVLQDAVEQCGLAAAQITGDQQHGCFFLHISFCWLFFYKPQS